jgi:hypothetical protein
MFWLDKCLKCQDSSSPANNQWLGSQDMKTAVDWKSGQWKTKTMIYCRLHQPVAHMTKYKRDLSPALTCANQNGNK